MDIVFGKKWFEKHQRKLLWLMNTLIIKDVFRSYLGISKIKDFNNSHKIYRIVPNGIHIHTGNKDEYKFVLFSGNTIAQAFYKKFKYIWHLMHYWDELFANKYAPELNFGFDTLTVYPDPHAETNSVDGWAMRDGVSESWATITAGAGTDHNDTTAGLDTMQIIERDNTNFAKNSRSIFLFDTSALTASATISACTMSLYASTTSSNDIGGTFEYNIYTSTPASNTDLVNADYSQLGTTAQCDTVVSFTTWDAAGGSYVDFAFNATGLGNISKTGVSKFGLRNSNYDVAGSTPGGSGTFNGTYIRGNFAAADTSTDPKLVITYTLPATATGNMFIVF